MATCENLTEFSYSGCRPETAGTKFIAQGLRKLVENYPDKASPMTHIKLEDCSFGAEDDEYPALTDLAKALEKMPNLVHLNLRDGGDVKQSRPAQ